MSMSCRQAPASDNGDVRGLVPWGEPKAKSFQKYARTTRESEARHAQQHQVLGDGRDAEEWNVGLLQSAHWPESVVFTRVWWRLERRSERSEFAWRVHKVVCHHHHHHHRQQHNHTRCDNRCGGEMRGRESERGSVKRRTRRADLRYWPSMQPLQSSSDWHLGHFDPVGTTLSLLRFATTKPPPPPSPPPLPPPLVVPCW
jgi:hypothetical protein